VAVTERRSATVTGPDDRLRVEWIDTVRPSSAESVEVLAVGGRSKRL